MDTIKNQFRENVPKYNRLIDNVETALDQFIKDKQISIFNIETRIKDESSFIEKITRKSYKNPFEDIEDICGVRIICYYKDDLYKLNSLLHEEFIVISEENKFEELKENEFGYTSNHYVVKLKDDWLTAPNYRGLNDLKIEIQVRTMLMHTWAAISHKLLYKHENDIPKSFRRKLNRLSALIEIADDEFNEIKNKKETYHDDAMKKNAAGIQLEELNSDNLLAFIKFYIPDRDLSEEAIPDLLEEIKSSNVTLNFLQEFVTKNTDVIKSLEIEESKSFKLEYPVWNATGFIRTILMLASDSYLKDCLDYIPDEYMLLIEDFKLQLH